MVDNVLITYVYLQFCVRQFHREPDFVIVLSKKDYPVLKLGLYSFGTVKCFCGIYIYIYAAKI